MTERLDRTSQAAKRASYDVLDLSNRWRNLSHNTRQWTLIIGASAGINGMVTPANRARSRKRR